MVFWKVTDSDNVLCSRNRTEKFNTFGDESIGTNVLMPDTKKSTINQFT